MYKPGWGQEIFKDATALVQRAIQRQKELAERENQIDAEAARSSTTAPDETADSPELEKENVKKNATELDENARQALVDELLREEEDEKRSSVGRSKNKKKKASSNKK
jgi:hypothetical protein